MNMLIAVAPSGSFPLPIWVAIFNCVAVAVFFIFKRK